MTTDTTTTTVSGIFSVFSNQWYNRSEFTLVSARGCKHTWYRADQLLLYWFGAQHHWGLDRSNATSYSVCCRPAHVWRPRMFAQLRARAGTPVKEEDSTLVACGSAFGTQFIV
jgi:hypothetical protein